MDVLMPQLGETVAEGKISVWYKNVGDTVAPGDNLFEIETDKTSMEVPAISGGVLSEIRVSQGEVAPVGAVVAVIGESESKPAPAGKPANKPAAKPASAPVASGNGAAAPSAPAPAATTPARPLEPFAEVRTPERNWGPGRVGNISVTPLARRLAGQRGIDLTRIQGTGPRGRIVARDVESAVPSAGAAAPAPAGLSSAEVRALYREVPHAEIMLDGMRKIIAQRLTLAKQTVPHFYLTADVDIADLLAGRKKLNKLAQGEGGESAPRISVNDFIIKALALALKRVPEANAVWAEDRILRFSRADVGVAVAIDGGLLTPVIRNAETKSLGTISAEMRDLAARARAKKLKPDEYQGGASAISNLGMYGVHEFSAIINPPQSTILAVGAARRAPVETEDGGVRFTDQMTVSLSCDHRVVDGAVGAELLRVLKAYLEQPLTMLI